VLLARPHEAAPGYAALLLSTGLLGRLLAQVPAAATSSDTNRPRQLCEIVQWGCTALQRLAQYAQQAAAALDAGANRQSGVPAALSATPIADNDTCSGGGSPAAAAAAAADAAAVVDNATTGAATVTAAHAAAANWVGPAGSLLAGLAALPGQQAGNAVQGVESLISLLPQAASLAAALQDYWRGPEQQAAALLEAAQAASYRTCAYLRCPNVGVVTLAPEAGEAAARSKKCGGCMVLKYCSAACQVG